MTLSDFIEKQSRIYEEFRDTSKIKLEGLIPKIVDNEGGYIIAYRHSKDIGSSIRGFSEKINNIVSSIIYNEDNIHTTLATFQVEDNFVFDKTVLNNIAGIVHDSLPLIKHVKIDYGEWLVNQDSGIVCGKPNDAFFHNAKKVVELGLSRGIQLKLPWGAHITVSRFLEKASKEQIRELIEVFKSGEPLGMSTPKYIDVGYYILTCKEFKFNVYKRFEL